MNTGPYLPPGVGLVSVELAELTDRPGGVQSGGLIASPVAQPPIRTRPRRQSSCRPFATSPTDISGKASRTSCQTGCLPVLQICCTVSETRSRASAHLALLSAFRDVLMRWSIAPCILVSLSAVPSSLSAISFDSFCITSSRTLSICRVALLSASPPIPSSCSTLLSAWRNWASTSVWRRPNCLPSAMSKRACSTETQRVISFTFSSAVRVKLRVEKKNRTDRYIATPARMIDTKDAVNAASSITHPSFVSKSRGRPQAGTPCVDLPPGLSNQPWRGGQPVDALLA